MEKFETPALLFCVDGKDLENGTFRKRWRHDNLMVSWKRCVFNSSGLGWKKDIWSFKKRRKKCISIFSILVLSPVYTEKLCPGEEGHPPSPVNFSERLYEKKDNPFTGAKSWQQRSHKLWLSHLDWVDLAGRAKVFIWKKVAPLRGWPCLRKRVIRLPSSSGRANYLFLMWMVDKFCDEIWEKLAQG